MLANGVVSMANDVAAALRVRSRDTRAARRRTACSKSEGSTKDEIPEIGETRLRIANTGHREVWALDSIALARDARIARAIVVTGSHGALLGGKPDTMLGVDVFAAFFNDAGGGKDDAGFARLPVLDAARRRGRGTCRTTPRASATDDRPTTPASSRA